MECVWPSFEYEQSWWPLITICIMTQRIIMTRVHFWSDRLSKRRRKLYKKIYMPLSTITKLLRLRRTWPKFSSNRQVLLTLALAQASPFFRCCPSSIWSKPFKSSHFYNVQLCHQKFTIRSLVINCAGVCEHIWWMFVVFEQKNHCLRHTFQLPFCTQVAWHFCRSIFWKLEAGLLERGMRHTPVWKYVCIVIIPAGFPNVLLFRCFTIKLWQKRQNCYNQVICYIFCWILISSYTASNCTLLSVAKNYSIPRS